MKILEKIKKVFLGVGVFFYTVPMKIYGVTGMAPLYGPPQIDNDPKISREKIINIIAMSLMILMIGTVIYIMNGKSSKLKKFMTILLVVGIILFLCLK